MVKRGDCINNPVTGERIQFLQTAEDTDGGLLKLMVTVKPDSVRRAALVHPVQVVHFSVSSGTLNLITGNVEHRLSGGQVIEIPCGTPYSWWNGGEDELISTIEFQPALNTEDVFMSLFALAMDGKTDTKGMPNFLQSAVISRKYKHEVYMAKPSIKIQKLISVLTAWLGRLLGYKADYPYQPTIVLETSSKNGELAPVPIENRCE